MHLSHESYSNYRSQTPGLPSETKHGQIQVCLHHTTIIEFTNTFIIQSTSISCLAGDKRLHYNLVGVVAHMKLFGDCGHYTSMVKSQHSNVTVNWVHMDDGQVLEQYTAEPLIKDPLRKGQPLCNRTNRFVQPLYTGRNSQRVLYSEVPHCSVTTPIMAI